MDCTVIVFKFDLCQFQLMETACQDTRAFLASKSSLLGPDFLPDHPESQSLRQPAQQLMPAAERFFDAPYSGGGTDITGGSFTSSQTSAFTKRQPLPSAGYHHFQHQPRSSSVPIHQDDLVQENLVVESEMSVVGVGSHSGNFRSQSQNSGAFKKPASTTKPFR